MKEDAKAKWSCELSQICGTPAHRSGLLTEALPARPTLNFKVMCVHVCGEFCIRVCIFRYVYVYVLLILNVDSVCVMLNVAVPWNRCLCVMRGFGVVREWQPSSIRFLCNNRIVWKSLKKEALGRIDNDVQFCAGTDQTDMLLRRCKVMTQALPKMDYRIKYHVWITCMRRYILGRKSERCYQNTQTSTML